MTKSLLIYTDGGARGNPGPAGLGVAIYDQKDLKEPISTIDEYLGTTTNNQAEYMAIIRGLERAKELGAEEVQMRMDSELAVKQLNGEYRVKNPELAKRFLEVHNLRSHFKKISFAHVPRERNKVADALVNKAIDEALGKT